MKSASNQDLTVLLKKVSNGDKQAVEELLAVAYPELRKIAANRLRLERADHTLQPTALINELYLHLFGGEPIPWQNRAHFFATVARQMRFILIDHARKKRIRGQQFTISLEGGEADQALQIAVSGEQDVVELDAVLQKLEEIDTRAAQCVELRVFVGLTMQEIAEVQGVNLSTVKRDWDFAKSWLYSRLNSPSDVMKSQPPEAE